MSTEVTLRRLDTKNVRDRAIYQNMFSWASRSPLYESFNYTDRLDFVRWLGSDRHKQVGIYTNDTLRGVVSFEFRPHRYIHCHLFLPPGTTVAGLRAFFRSIKVLQKEWHAIKQGLKFFAHTANPALEAALLKAGFRDMTNGYFLWVS